MILGARIIDLVLASVLAASVGGVDANQMHPTSSIADVRKSGEVTVWYLGHCGFAVRVNEKLLIFDYTTEFGTASGNPRAGGLSDGTVEIGDLSGLDVYVFVTHSHSDHYDRSVLEWETGGERIEYFFGWEAGDNSDHHYLVGPRATTEVNGLQIYTINSHHSRVPEVAYLVHVDSHWIYHNGDYRQDYIPDFEYLGTLTDHIDVVFTGSVYDEDTQYAHQAHYLMEHFRPDALFPMHNRDAEEAGEDFARVMAQRGFETRILAPQRRGDSWEIGG